MTDKITLTNLVNLQNETTAVNAINANNAAIITAVDNTLSRDGTSPNSMGANLDMNSNKILNLPSPTTATEPVRLTEFNAAVFGTNIGTGLTTTNTTNSTSTSTGSINTPGGMGVAKDVFIGGLLNVAGNLTTNVSGDLSGTLPSPTIAANAVTNAKAAQAPAFTIKGNSTGSTANVTDISIPALTQKVSPASNDMVMLVDSAASNALKFTTAGALAVIGAVASLNAKTGALTWSVNKQKFTSSGTYTPTANMVYCIIEAVGGGGGGGGCQAGGGGQTGGNGGGGGAYARLVASAATIGASKAVTIGAGGAGNVSGNPGAAGGDTSVGSICIAKGGSGGTGNTFGSVAITPTAGGLSSSSVGDVTLDGEQGDVTSFSTVVGILAKGGNGGDSFFGRGGKSIAAGDVSVSSQPSARGPGGGGAGASGNNISANGTGGNGVAGLVLITEFLVG